MAIGDTHIVRDRDKGTETVFKETGKLFGLPMLLVKSHIVTVEAESIIVDENGVAYYRDAEAFPDR